MSAFVHANNPDPAASLTGLEIIQAMKAGRPALLTTAQIAALERGTSPATHTSATLTLAEGDRNSVLRVSAASNAVAIEIPDTLPGADSGTSDVWECQLDIVDGETNAVTISTGAGLLTPVYMGSLNAITVSGSQVAIQVVRGVARVIIVEPYTP